MGEDRDLKRAVPDRCCRHVPRVSGISLSRLFLPVPIATGRNSRVASVQQVLVVLNVRIVAQLSRRNR
jgi:hypothetical protein